MNIFYYKEIKKKILINKQNLINIIIIFIRKIKKILIY